MMPDLATMQRLIADAVRGGPADPALLDLVPALGLSAERRLAVYRNHHRISLVEALRTTFAVTRERIGAALFDRVAAGYVAACPPVEPRLSAYGEGLPDALVHASAIGVPAWGADLARLDWALHACWSAEDGAALRLDQLATLAPEALSGLVLAPLPAGCVLNLGHAVDLAWRGAEGPPAAQRISILVFRDVDGDAGFERIPPGLATFLAALSGGVCLGEAAEAAAAHPEFDLAQSLALACDRGLFAAITQPGTPPHA